MKRLIRNIKLNKTANFSKNKIETFKIITGVVIILVLIIILGITVHNDTKKQVEKCLKNGNSQNYCLYEVNN